MSRVGVTQAREQLSELVELALYTGRPTILTRRGRDVAVIVNVDWYKEHDMTPNQDEDADVKERGALPQIPGPE